MVEDNIIEGSLKYRDGKKWKQRWAVLNKLSPVADVLQLQLYRDSRDRARGAPTKASLALPNSLALTTGFTLDKECHTLALLCKDLSLILAFDSRDRLLQWNSKISFTLGQEQQFLVQIIQVPVKSRLSLGPCRLHIRDHRFCLTSGTPPRLLAAWALIDLRRYGVVDGRFVWEGGSKSGRGTGIHLALSDAPNDITRSLDLASRGALGSTTRRGSSSQATSGSIQRDAAMWLRDVGAIDLYQYSEAGDSVSIVPSEVESILSPRSEFSHDRRPDCDVTAGSSYVTGSSSSSGSLIGEDPGWWASTWSSRKGSMWEMNPSPIPETLYDSPRLFPHSQTSIGVTQIPPNATPFHHHHTQSLKFKSKSYQPQPPFVTPNPMDNYDVPKPHYQHYDVPRKFSAPYLNSGHSTCMQHAAGIDTCGKMLCWAGSLMCRRGNLPPEHVEPVRVNGEGRMPVLDANTGTLIKGQGLTASCSGGISIPDSFQFSKPDSCQCQHEIMVDPRHCTKDAPIYAVVDKSKKSAKPRAKTPPPLSPLPSDDQTPTNCSSNYENVTFAVGAKTPEAQEFISSRSDQCFQCGGMVPDVDSSNLEHDASCNSLLSGNLEQSSVSLPQDESKRSTSEKDHYLLMGPGPPLNTSTTQSHYLCMKKYSDNGDRGKKYKDSPTLWKPGRSLSLARGSSASHNALRRSTSADSILHEPLTVSQHATPDITPNVTPLTSPPMSPYRTSTPRSDSMRGRQKKRTLGQCHSNQCQQNSSELSDIISTSSDCKTTSSLTSTTEGSLQGSDVPGVISPVVNAYTIPSDIPCQDTPILRRSSSMPGKNSNRDSASSSDSGVCESPKPHDRVLLSHCLHNSLPRGPRQKATQGINQLKTGTINGSCRDLGTVTGDAKSSSSGTSDISDYLDTLSLSSHSSSDHERILGRASVTTLRPRSGREYTRLDRSALDSGMLPPVGEVNQTSEKK